MLKWKYIKFKYSTIAICIWLIVISSFLYIMSCYCFDNDGIIYEIFFALFIGIIASAIVTLIITFKQEKDIALKKKAILFDMGFELNEYVDSYEKFQNSVPKEFDLKIKKLYFICKKPAEHIINLYKNNAELFDATEIIYIRNINASYYFFNKLLNTELSDEDIKKYFSEGLNESSQGMKEYWKMINEINKNLNYLKIKWEMDEII